MGSPSSAGIGMQALEIRPASRRQIGRVRVSASPEPRRVIGKWIGVGLRSCARWAAAQGGIRAGFARWLPADSGFVAGGPLPADFVLSRELCASELRADGSDTAAKQAISNATPKSDLIPRLPTHWTQLSPCDRSLRDAQPNQSGRLEIGRFASRKRIAHLDWTISSRVRPLLSRERHTYGWTRSRAHRSRRQDGH